MAKIFLEAVRANVGMTQKEWAKILGVTNITVVNWEKGRSEPTISQVRKMSELSGIPIGDIYPPEPQKA